MNHMLKILLALSLACFVLTSASAQDEHPRYKPSSRSPEPLDIRTNAYGHSESAPTALGIGDIAPDFQVLSPLEETIDSRGLRAKGPLVIVFYRGHW